MQYHFNHWFLMDHSIYCEEPLDKPFCKPPEPEEQSKYVFTEKLHANNHI